MDRNLQVRFSMKVVTCSFHEIITVRNCITWLLILLLIQRLHDSMYDYFKLRIKRQRYYHTTDLEIKRATIGNYKKKQFQVSTKSIKSIKDSSQLAQRAFNPQKVSWWRHGSSWVFHHSAIISCITFLTWKSADCYFLNEMYICRHFKVFESTKKS